MSEENYFRIVKAKPAPEAETVWDQATENEALRIAQEEFGFKVEKSGEYGGGVDDGGFFRLYDGGNMTVVCGLTPAGLVDYCYDNFRHHPNNKVRRIMEEGGLR